MKHLKTIIKLTKSQSASSYHHMLPLLMTEIKYSSLPGGLLLPLLLLLPALLVCNYCGGRLFKGSSPPDCQEQKPKPLLYASVGIILRLMWFYAKPFVQNNL